MQIPAEQRIFQVRLQRRCEQLADVLEQQAEIIREHARVTSDDDDAGIDSILLVSRVVAEVNSTAWVTASASAYQQWALGFQEGRET